MRQKPTLRLEKGLTREANAGSQRHWKSTEERYFKVLVRVARRVRDLAPEILTVTDDFVAFLADEEGGLALARKTIPKRRFETLFAATAKNERERSDVAERAPGDQAAFLVTRFGCYEGVTTEDAQRQLLTLGEQAVPHLLAVLGDEKNGWVAAKLLGSIGCASDEAIQALREHAAPGSWHVRALGMLGDNDWLASSGDPTVALTGLAAPLKAVATTDRTPPLSYRALEAYLDQAGDAARERAEHELKPGTSYAKLDKGGVDEAIRGLSSKHAVIRWHAASLLGHRGLGKTASKRILPALARCLRDDHPVVRRLAVLAISYWKEAAKPYRAAIAELADDPDETVRSIVAHVASSTT